MTIADWLIIAAILSGPVVAVQLTRYLDDKAEVRARKLKIFKDLMATRAYGTSWTHVEALNRIDLEFQGSAENEKAVITAWKKYLDLLNRADLPLDQWSEKRVELFVSLLHEMAKVLKYDFDPTHIKNSFYSPKAHGQLENEQTQLRQGLLSVLRGESAIPIVVQNSAADDQDG